MIQIMMQKFRKNPDSSEKTAAVSIYKRGLIILKLLNNNNSKNTKNNNYSFK